MQSSTVKREKLIRPQHLVFIVVLFVVAFIVLVPNRQTYQYADSPGNDGKKQSVDPLDIAYLKATHSVGENTGADVAGAVQSLVREGRVEEARGLVGAYPEITLSEPDRYLLDLELAAADWHALDRSDTALVTEKNAQFLNLLTLVQTRPVLQEPMVLERVLEKLLALKRSALGDDTQQTLLFNVYQLLSKRDSSNAIRWLRSCGETLANKLEPTLSQQCYRLALQMGNGPEQFDLRIALLRQLHKTDDHHEIEQLQLRMAKEASNDPRELEVLAGVLLEYEHPELAHPLFEKLAVIDESRRVQWLGEAAKWAEAANQLERAVVYLKKMQDVADPASRLATEERIQSLLVAAGQNNEALDRITVTIDENPSNNEELRRAIPKARRLGDDKLAQQWNERLLEREPENIEAINRQVALALGRSDLATALRWSRAAVDLQPNEPNLRRKLARVSEWAGDPMLATYHWQWLAENTDDASAVEEVIRLSALTLQPQIAATSIRRLTRKQKPSAEQVTQMIAFYELEGQPQLAAESLRELITRYGTDRHVMTELALLHYRHKHYRQSLVAWQQVRNHIGQSSQETLARIELHWRLNQPEQAIDLARELQGTSLISDASDYQVRIISELAWRYREHKLALLVKPMLASVEGRKIRVIESQRLIDAWLGIGDKKNAQVEALEKWRETGFSDFGLQAMRIAFERGDDVTVNEFLTDSYINRELFDSPDYWNLRAAVELRKSDDEKALMSYQRALKIDANNIDAVAGLLWLHIGRNDVATSREILEKFHSLALRTPGLWVPYALAELQAGDAVSSLTWFDLLKKDIDSDYGLLLTYADALELAGQSGDATAVRSYALESLRPLLTDGSREDHDLLLQQYSSIVARYATTEQQLDWTNAILDEDSLENAEKRFWREDMAISWLMSTQRHEYARLVMADIHRHRLREPAWQTLAIAMKEKDVEVVTALLAEGTGISVGDQILAMRQIGQDRQAHTLSVETLAMPSSVYDQRVAQQQYGLLRLDRPSHSSGRYRSLSVNSLGVSETGLSLRHSLFNRDIGYGVDLSKRRFSSKRFDLNGNQQESEIALSLFLGNKRQGGRITTGYITTEEDDLMFAEGQYHQRGQRGKTALRAEITYNEKVEGAPELRIGSVQNRASVTLDVTVGAREYFMVGADVNDISTKVEKNRVARGMQARAEFGLRGANGSHSWSTSLQARSTINDREETIPVELLLSDTTTMDSLLAEQSAMLGVGFTLARGGVGEEYPQTGSPRYFFQASVGQTWPAERLGLQLNAGAGMRVLGGDELGFTLSHDAQSRFDSSVDSDTTSFGLNYRYHF